MTEFYSSEAVRPAGFTYPPEFTSIIELGLVDFAVWNFIPGKRADQIIQHLSGTYKESYVPFAEQRGSDDLACWVPGSDKVYIIEYSAVDGEEIMNVHETFWSWFTSATSEMIEHLKSEIEYG